MTTRCPHANVIYCPLYVASHIPRADGCCYGEIEEGCAVERGELKYKTARGKLMARQAELVAQCRWLEENDVRAVNPPVAVKGKQKIFELPQGLVFGAA